MVNSELPYEPKAFLGIKSYSSNQNHIAFIYYDDLCSKRICHLGWHLNLMNQEFDENTDTGYLEDSIKFEDDSSDLFLSSHLASVKQINEKLIPYGFNFSKVCFCEKTGVFTGLEKGEGLTCSSFILAVFEACGLPGRRQFKVPISDIISQ